MTDGYLIDNHPTTSLTTQLPTRNATVQDSQWPSSQSEDTDVIEDSHLGGSYATQIPLPDDNLSSDNADLGDSNYNSMTSAAPQQEKEHYATTTPGVSDPHSSTSTEPSKDHDDTSDSDPTQSHFTSSSMPNEVMTSVRPESILDFETTPGFAIDWWDPEMLEEEEIHQQSTTESPSMTSVSNTETSTESSTVMTTLETTPGLFEELEGSGFGFEQETETTANPITEFNQPQEGKYLISTPIVRSTTAMTLSLFVVIFCS